MTTRTKITISSYTTSIMMLLMVFYKPLGIPEPYQWVLMIATLIPLSLMIYLQKILKKELAAELVLRKKRKQILTMIVIGTIIGLSCPFWLPLTGKTSFGAMGDLIVGLITTAIIIGILGPKLRKT